MLPRRITQYLYFGRKYESRECSEYLIASRQNMRKLFRCYLENPLEMGKTARRRIARVGLERAAAYYIAGMTDRFASREYQRISHPAREV